MRLPSVWWVTWRKPSSSSAAIPGSGIGAKISPATSVCCSGPVGPTLIAYRPNPEWVEVLFVERCEVDWERILGEGLE
jgi:hypothetical protein